MLQGELIAKEDSVDSFFMYTSLCPVLDSAVQDRQGATAESPAEATSEDCSISFMRRLRKLGLFSLEKDQRRSHESTPVSQRWVSEDGARLSSVVPSNRTKAIN